MIEIIVNIFKFVFWAPRVAQDAIYGSCTKFVLFSKILVGSTETTISGLSLVFILLGNEEWVQLGAYGLIVYALLGLVVLVFYNQYHGDYLP